MLHTEKDRVQIEFLKAGGLLYLPCHNGCMSNTNICEEYVQIQSKMVDISISGLSDQNYQHVIK